jgi:hypothetical protein
MLKKQLKVLVAQLQVLVLVVKHGFQLFFYLGFQDVICVYVGRMHDDQVEAAEGEVTEGDEGYKEEAVVG